MLRYKPGENFPKGYMLGGVPCIESTDPPMISPIELTYGSLIKVVRLTQENIESGKWTPKIGKSYLQENCIKSKLSNKIVERAKNCNQLRLSFEAVENDPAEWEAMIEDNNNNPEKNSASVIPGVWERGVPLKMYFDTPMHLLFFGVVKAVFLYVGIWSHHCGRKQGFQIIAKKRLQQLDDLKLSWLSFQVDRFDNWTGWVSEKYHSLSRVALWIYGPLMIVDDVPPFVPPMGIEPQHWRLEHYKKWLTVRSLPNNGSKDELKARVMAYLALPQEQQPKLPPPSYGKANGVILMLRSMVVLLTTIMQPTVEGKSHQDILELRTRLFMNAVEEFERPLRRKKDLQMKKDQEEQERKKAKAAKSKTNTKVGGEEEKYSQGLCVSANMDREIQLLEYVESTRNHSTFWITQALLLGKVFGGKVCAGRKEHETLLSSQTGIVESTLKTA
jgi:hypothetical protein